MKQTCNVQKHEWTPKAVRCWARLLKPVGCVALFSVLSANAAELSGPPAKSADLFQTTKVWTIHLQFTPDQWKAMEPTNDFGFPGGGPRFGGGRGGPGGPGGGGPGGPGGPGPGMFGPAMFLAPGFLKGDQDNDGKLSKAEFAALGERWFTEWDKNKNGQLNIEQLQAGVSSSLLPAEFGQGGPRPGGMMGRGGPGGGGMGGGGMGGGGMGGGGMGGGPPGIMLQGQEGHRNGLASAAGIDFQYVHADLEFEGKTMRDVAVRYKGNGTFMESRGSNKRSFKVELNKYVKGQKVAGVTKLNLHNNVTDPSWMNEVLSHRLFRDSGVPAPRTAYARVYVTVPGQYDRQYFGLYSLVEDVDKHFAEDRFGTKEGAIFKPVTHDLFGYMGEDWSKYAQTYDAKTELSVNEKRSVIDLSKLVTGGSDEDFAAKIGDYVDLAEFSRFMSATVWLSTMDSILMVGQNFYVYLHPQTHKFQFIPWDLDHSFGQFPMAGTQEERETLSIQKPWRGENRFLERVFKTEAFQKLYHSTMAELCKTMFLPARFSKQVDEVAAAIRPAVAEESAAKLAQFDKAVAGETVDRFFGGGPGPRMEGEGRRRFGPGGMMQGSKPIKAFAVARARSVDDQLAGKSNGASESDQGFGGPGPRMVRMGPGGPGGPGGGPGGFGPGMFIARGFMEALDANKDGKLTHEEFTAGFAKWFKEWNTDHSGTLSDEQLRQGINEGLMPFRGGPPPDDER